MAPFGLRSDQRVGDSVPIDLSAIPSMVSRESYQALPLAVRNAVVVTIIAGQSGVSAGEVAAALPAMLGVQAIVSQSALLNNQRIAERACCGARPDDGIVQTVLQGELDLAVRRCVPTDDRNRAAIERNLAKVGSQLDERFILTMLLSTRYPRMGLDLTGIFNRAVEGQMDLAAAVGTIRDAGQQCATEMAKIR